tara:strand:- start:6048 stop:7130 length:1083 start_codon:yes stop_codon:yes gene_type:complete
MKKTSLYSEHKKINAKMLPFAGYEMPITYGKISDEYYAVRTKCGIFDVSHMGQIEIKGKDSFNFIQKITINNLSKIKNLGAQYSAICHINGNLLDDIIIFKFSDSNFILIVNASNLEKVKNHISKYSKDFDLIINYLNCDFSLIALQGPESRKILNNISDEKINIKFYNLKKLKLLNENIIISRTGYTGELGYEIMGKHLQIKKLWNYFLNNKIQPCGLAVRDVLRTEMKYCLYGNDINDNTNPLEAGLSWITDLNKKDFIGKSPLVDININGIQRHLVGFKMIDKAIPRKDYLIFADNQQIGFVTSGVHSPILDRGIGMGYINNGYNKIGTKIQIKIRSKFMNAEIVKTPFLNNTSIHT